MQPNAFATASGGHAVAPSTWLTPSRLRPLVDANPAAAWLALHGAAFGFAPDTPSPFGQLTADLGRAFERAWRTHEAPEAPLVCASHHDARQAPALAQTLWLMAQGEPVIAAPALWWAPDEIYGIPDLLIRSDQLSRLFPGLDVATVVEPGAPPHYLVADLKFTSGLGEGAKGRPRARHEMQVRLLSYMLGQIQGWMPKAALLITRDGVRSPFVVPVTSGPDGPLDADLAGWCAGYRFIRDQGAALLPWRDEAVALNLAADDKEWASAYTAIRALRFPDGNPLDVAEIGPGRWTKLEAKGITSLPALHARRHELEALKVGLSAALAPRVRAMLEAHFDGVEQAPPACAVPPRARYELFIDFEYLNNLHVDFERQWSTLEGRPMVFLIGLAWEGPAGWEFRRFFAPSETPEGERQLFAELLAFLDGHVGGLAAQADAVRLYHWSAAEASQLRGAATRQTLRGFDLLPLLVDLRQVMTLHACAVPGALSYGLKAVAGALGARYPELAPAWPAGLDDGLGAMLLGWRMYERADPLASPELMTLTEYLKADCRALHGVLRWMRAEAAELV